MLSRTMSRHHWYEVNMLVSRPSISKVVEWR